MKTLAVIDRDASGIEQEALARAVEVIAVARPHLQQHLRNALSKTAGGRVDDYVGIVMDWATDGKERSQTVGLFHVRSLPVIIERYRLWGSEGAERFAREAAALLQQEAQGLLRILVVADDFTSRLRIEVDTVAGDA